VHDLRHAFRALFNAPGYSVAVTVVLASGIAMATVVFAVVDGVLFKPLPFTRPAELFVVSAIASSDPRAQTSPVSYREIKIWMDAVPELGFSGMSAVPESYDAAPGRELWSAAVDERFFDVVGRQPLIGGFRPEDFDFTFASVSNGAVWQPQIISYRLWRTSYGGDPKIIGTTVITAERQGATYGRRIVGVLPPDFVFPIDDGGAQPDVLIPISRALQRSSERRFRAVVRIPDAADVPQIGERLRAATTLASAAISQRPRGDGRIPAKLDDVRLTTLSEHLGTEERGAFLLVAAAAGLMLLLACVNVAGIAAAKNLERRRELAVRRALGANCWQLSRGLLVEIATLGVAGTATALAISKPMLMGTVALLPSTLTLMKPPEIDGRVLAVTVLVSFLTVLIVSLWPARIAARVRPESVLNALGGTWTAIGRRSRFLLVGSQVALGFVLLTAGGLSIASFAAAWRTDAGIERDDMLLLEAFVVKFGSDQEDMARLSAGRSILVQLPGVQDVAVSSIQPLFARRSPAWSPVAPPGWKGRLEGIAARRVSDNYFRLMGLNLVRGRWPARGEWASSQPVAVVSVTAARMLWPNLDPLGQSLVHQPPRPQAPPPASVIAVVEDARYGALDAEPAGEIYLPDPIDRLTTGVYLHARTSGSADRVLPTAVAAVESAGLRLAQATTHEDAMFAALKHRALPAWLFGLLSAAAVLVLGAGLLGILAMSAAQRTRELGIRLALGATGGAVTRLLVREQLTPVLCGLAAGATTSAWAARFVESQLYGVHPYDPMVWLLIVVTIIGVAIGGSLIPAVRAARVDPVRALRAD
jgi:putative ABC transport system permease protein